MSDIIKDITEAVFISDAPKPSSAIVLADGSFPAPALKASQLLKSGFAPYIIIGGGVLVFDEKDKLHLEKRRESEKLFYREMLEYLCVKSDMIKDELCECVDLSFNKKQSSNGLDHGMTRLILVCRPHLAGRSLAAYRRSFPMAEILVVPQESDYLNRENWFLEKEKARIVLDEANACGVDISGFDLFEYEE